MIEIAICDDNLSFTSWLEEQIVDLGKKHFVDLENDIFYTGEVLIDHIRNGKRYDLIFLDIEMLGMNGVDVAFQIRKYDSKVLIIYVTSHESYAPEAFEVSAFRFLIKPVDIEILEKYFISAIENIHIKPEYFEYHYNKVCHKIAIKDIMYFQSDKRITYITTNDNVIKCYEKLNAIERRLETANIIFLRVHQSFLINPEYIETYMYNSIILTDGTEISISVKRRKEVAQQYCRFKGEKVID